MKREGFLYILWRYLCAMAVAFAVAVVVVGLGLRASGIGLMTFLSGANLIGVTIQRPIGSGSIAFAAAFLGTLAGSMCILRHSRIAACLVLTLILLMFYQTLWFLYWQHEVTSKHGNSSLALQMGGGGCFALVVMIIVTRRKLRNDEESSPAAA